MEILKINDFMPDDVFNVACSLTPAEKELIIRSYEESSTFMRLDDIIPYDNNPRLNEDAVDAVADSIRSYGFQQVIVVDSGGVIVVGHTRRLACLALGLRVVPVGVASCLSPEKVKAYRLDDNKTAELSTWEYANLQTELKGLEESGYDMDSLAFSKEELDRLLGDDDETEDDKDGETDPDDAPEASDSEYDSVDGGIYRLGVHRLVCGDSREALDVQTLLDGDGECPVRLWLTDPPYNVKYAGRSGVDLSADGAHLSDRNEEMTIANDSMPDDEFEEFIGDVFRNCAENIAPGSAFYIFHGYTISHVIRKALLDNGMRLSNQLVWTKNNFALGFGDYFMMHEPVWYGWRDGAPHRWFGPHDGTTTTVQQWGVNPNKEHPTMKPVDMLRYFIRNSSQKGEIVLDTFGGSGSTLIACEQTGRVCRTMEIMPKYCDVIRRRYAEFMNGKGCDWKSITPKIGDVAK